MVQFTLTGVPDVSTTMADWPLNVVDLRGFDLGSSIRSLGARLNAAGKYFYIRASGDNDADNVILANAIGPSETGLVVSVNGWYRAAS
jgi:hypothetical protein